MLKFLSPSLSRHLAASSLVLVANLSHSSVVLGQEETAQKSEEKDTANMEADATEEALPLTFTSDGSPIAIEDLGITITPPAGWQVYANSGSLSLVMKEPEKKEEVYDKATYRRNITVAAIHKASPIDEKRAGELKEQLTETFNKDSLVSDFKILEHKFFNYHGENDGLLVYSALNIGQYPMMQMHILVSGAEKQFLLSYTDLAEAFADSSNGNFEQAWNSMVSIDVTGEAPDRMNEYLRYGAIAGGFLLLMLVIAFLRFRSSRKDYLEDIDGLGPDDLDHPSTSTLATFHGGWNLDSDSDGDWEDDDFEFTVPQEGSQPRTKITSYV